MKPKVSVLIPSYNHSNYIKETISSVLNQTFTDFELIVLDDCSTDDSVSVIKSFSDDRLKFIKSFVNSGVVSSLNKMIKIASGEYIAVLGSDDVWNPDKLEKQVFYLEGHPNIAACFSRVTVIDENSFLIKKSNIFPTEIFNIKNSDRLELIKDFFFSGNHLCHSSVLIRSDVQNEIGNYDPFFRQLHDFDMWIRLLLKYDIFIFEEPLVKYRFVGNASNISKSCEENTFRLFNEASVILRKMLNKISDEDFKKAFSPFILCNENLDSDSIVCEKFFLLKKYGIWQTSCKSAAFEFLTDNLSETVYDCFMSKYDFNLSDIYEFTGNFISNYKSDIFKEENSLKNELIQKNEEISYLKQEISKLTEDFFIKKYLKVKRFVRK